MKHISLISIALMFFVPAAFADHALKDMMNKPAIASAVKAAMAAKGVYCAIDKSLQLKPTAAATNDYDSWRQVAICFGKEADSKAFAATPYSNEFGGIYGVKGATAILDITYNQNTGKVYEVSIR